jgi:hypothetical protein
MSQEVMAGVEMVKVALEVSLDQDIHFEEWSLVFR